MEIGFMRSTRFALSLVLLVPCAALAANLGIIDGTVRDDSGPAAEVHVLLLRDGRRVDDHVTDANGHFEFEQVPFGVYQVKAVSKEGRVQQHDLRVASGDVVQVELVLPTAGEEIVVTAQRPTAPIPAKTPS